MPVYNVHAMHELYIQYIYIYVNVTRLASCFNYFMVGVGLFDVAGCFSLGCLVAAA